MSHNLHFSFTSFPVLFFTVFSLLILLLKKLQKTKAADIFHVQPHNIERWDFFWSSFKFHCIFLELISSWKFQVIDRKNFYFFFKCNFQMFRQKCHKNNFYRLSGARFVDIILHEKWDIFMPGRKISYLLFTLYIHKDQFPNQSDLILPTFWLCLSFYLTKKFYYFFISKFRSHKKFIFCWKFLFWFNYFCFVVFFYHKIIFTEF